MKDRDTEIMDTEKSGAKDTRNEDQIINIECGLNRAVLHLDRLCQGSKGACILFEETWMTPNEFQAASGRETAKDWKRSIKHHDKSLKLLMVKGLFSTEPAACGCDYCTGAEPLPPPPSPLQSTSVVKETRKKRAPADTDKTKGVLREQAKRGRKKRKKAKPAAPVARQLRRRSAPVSRWTITRVSPRTTTRASSRAGRRTSNATNDGNKESSESESVESDSESDEKQESSSDEAEESLPLADVKKGLCAAKGKQATTGCDDAAPAVGRKIGRKAATKAESPQGDDASARANDVTCDGGLGIKTNSAENKADEPKVRERKCAETVEGDSAVESPTTDCNEDCVNIGKAAQDASERHDVNKKSLPVETDGANESTSQIDVRNSKTLKIEPEKASPVENDATPCLNGTQRNTLGSALSASRGENDVIAPSVQQSAQTEIVKAETGQSRIGCSAPGEVVLEASAIAPQANKRAEDTEPANGNTAVAKSAAIPTPNDSDSAIDIEDGNARSNATLPKEEHDVTANNNLASTEDRTRAGTGDVTEQDGADGQDELLSPKREARLLSIIQELKTYKKRLVTNIEAKKRTPVAGQSPLREADSPSPSDVTKEEADGCPPDTRGCTPDMLHCTSTATLPASSSPLQQLLFDPSFHPFSSVAQPLTGTTSRVPGKRRQNATRRQMSYSTPGEGLLTAWSTSLNHAAKCNGVAADGPPSAVVAYYFDSPAPTAGATGAEHSALPPGKHPELAAAARSYDVASRGADDKCLLKIPKRCNTNIAPSSANDRSAKNPLLDLTAQKRKSSAALPEVGAKKQRSSWPIPVQGNVNLNMNSTPTGFVTSVSGVPSMSSVSLCDMSRTGRPRNDSHTAPVSKIAAAGHGSKSSRRPHISSWSADDVFAFVLSTPHASIYAKEFMEHRISGRVLQNLTAIQMMRILRIGEHAAVAVRTTVEKLLELTPALTQGVRR